jgi:hypothetical protein
MPPPRRRNIGAAGRTATAMVRVQRMLCRDRKGLADTAAQVVILALHQATGRSRTVRHKAVARLKGYKALPFCIAKAVQSSAPTATSNHASRRSIWRTTWLKKS